MASGKSLTKLYKNQDLKYKSIGYQTFNLYALALIKKGFEKHSFWQSSDFKKTLSYLDSKEFNNKIEDNKYGYPYNAPGFEIPFIKYIFEKDKNKAIAISEKYLQRQIEKTFNKNTLMFENNTQDKNILSARIYETTRLPGNWLKKTKYE
jgi:hypothetical protein